MGKLKGSLVNYRKTR